MSDNLSMAGKLPSGDQNGLHPIMAQLIEEAAGRAPKVLHPVIALLDAKKLTINTDDGAHIPCLRIRRIELVTGDDLKVAETMIRRALDKRSAGGADGALPFELEQELEQAFSDILMRADKAASGDDDLDDEDSEAPDDEGDPGIGEEPHGS